MNDLSRIDWNLLPALDALLSEQNVSRAARRVGVTQPAMSSALKRLRRHFKDDLMVRHGHAYQLTPLAERLAPLARDLVRSSVDIATALESYDPATSTRHFTIAATSAMQTTLVPLLLADLSAAAPHVGVSLLSPFAEPFRNGDDVLAGTDGWLAPSEMLPGRDRVGEWWDQWVCVVADDHPTVDDALTLEDARALPWVIPMIRAVPISHLDALAAHGIDPTIAIYAEGFVAVPFLVSHSDRIGIVQRAVAEKLAPASGTRVLECPWPVQPLRVTFWWDRRWAADPAHTWLRGMVEQCMLRHSVEPPEAARSS